MLSICVPHFVNFPKPKKNTVMLLYCVVSIYFRGGIILPIVLLLPLWRFPIFDVTDVSSIARNLTFALLFKIFKTHTLLLSLYVLPTASLNELQYFPTQWWASRKRLWRGGGKQFTLPLSILTGKLFLSSDVWRHFNHGSYDPDTSSGSSAQFLLRETHKAAIVTNSASNGYSGN